VGGCCELCGREIWTVWTPDHVPTCECITCRRCGRKVQHPDTEGVMSIAPTDQMAELYGDDARCLDCWTRIKEEAESKGWKTDD
jgi:hypothetical protein